MDLHETTLSALCLSLADVYLAMGYRGQTPDADVCRLVDQVLAEAEALCRPRYMYQTLEARLMPRCHVEAGGMDFAPGGIIGAYLPGMTHASFFVATAGAEYDDYLHAIKARGDILKEFVADSVGSVIAEGCVGLIGRELDHDPHLRHSLPYSPGYCGWNIAEQRKLFALFPPQPCGVRLSDSCLMWPVKSVSGFFGQGKDLLPQPYHCELCKNIHCYKRKEKHYDTH